MSKNSPIGNPVVIVDMATGETIHGVLSGITEAGINKQVFYSITQNNNNRAPEGWQGTRSTWEPEPDGVLITMRLQTLVPK